MKNKKIAVVYPYFAHYREPVFREMERKFHDFEIEYFGDCVSNLPSLQTIDFSDEFKFSYVKNIWLGRWLWQKGLFFKLFRQQPDIIIFLGQFNFISTWFSAIIFRLLGKKICFWGHGCYGNEIGVKKMVRYLFNRIPEMHLLYGNYAKSKLIKLGFNESKLKVIYNSLDYAQQKSVKSQLNSETRYNVRKSLFHEFDNLPLIVFIGRLTKVKNLELLIESLYILKKKGTPCNCLLIGSGPELGLLEKMVSEYCLNTNVKFFGESHDESVVGELIYSADLCVSPGNVGLTAVHSLSYGTPVVTHNNFGYQMPEFEVITPKITGSFYQYGSVKSLVECIEYWSSLTSKDKLETSESCTRVIDTCYNPKVQAELIYAALNEAV